MTITCPVNDSSSVCATMNSAGAGLGIFLQYMGEALPVLLIILAMVTIIVAVGYGVSTLIGKGIAGTHRK